MQENIPMQNTAEKDSDLLASLVELIQAQKTRLRAESSEALFFETVDDVISTALEVIVEEKTQNNTFIPPGLVLSKLASKCRYAAVHDRMLRAKEAQILQELRSDTVINLEMADDILRKHAEEIYEQIQQAEKEEVGNSRTYGKISDTRTGALKKSGMRIEKAVETHRRKTCHAIGKCNRILAMSGADQEEEREKTIKEALREGRHLALSRMVLQRVRARLDRAMHDNGPFAKKTSKEILLELQEIVLDEESSHKDIDMHAVVLEIETRPTTYGRRTRWYYAMPSTDYTVDSFRRYVERNGTTPENVEKEVMLTYSAIVTVTFVRFFFYLIYILASTLYTDMLLYGMLETMRKDGRGLVGNFNGYFILLICVMNICVNSSVFVFLPNIALIVLKKVMFKKVPPIVKKRHFKRHFWVLLMLFLGITVLQLLKISLLGRPLYKYSFFCIVVDEVLFLLIAFVVTTKDIHEIWKEIVCKYGWWNRAGKWSLLAVAVILVVNSAFYALRWWLDSTYVIPWNDKIIYSDKVYRQLLLHTSRGRA